jgi:hypothetical protein
MREKLPGLPDEGSFTFQMNLDPADTVHLASRMRAATGRSASSASRSPNAAATKLIFFGYVTGFQVGGSVGAIVKGDITIEIDGEVNWV